MIECMQCIDKVKDIMLYYSAAVNKPLLVRNRALIELPADKIPVGKIHYNSSFNLFQKVIQKGNIYYFYTD